MKANHTFTVVPRLPDELSSLAAISHNLGWLFDRRVRTLFESVDPELSRFEQYDPLGVLNRCSTTRLGELAADPSFIRRVDALLAELTAELDAPSWATSHESPLPLVAYLSPEFGLAASVPQYSGGLGVLAGDHLKAAADLHVPIVGVGLFYRSGYFRQMIDHEGRQHERFPVQHPVEVALSRVDDLTVELDIGGTPVVASIWKALVGPNPLYLLDTRIPGEGNPDQLVTDRLYGGGSEERIRQELLLGVGGMRALRALGIEPEVFHLNEGHAGFVTLERIRIAMIEGGLTFPEAIEAIRPSMLFTTHTPVPAGIDRFGREMVERYFGWWCRDTGVAMSDLLALGEEPGGDPAVFNLANMSLRLCGDANAVSLLHGHVSRTMFAPLWPELDVGDVPIGAVTNGVHAPTFMADDIADIIVRNVGPDWPLATREQFRALHAASPEELWDARNAGRRQLVEFLRDRARRAVAARNHGGDLAWIDNMLDPEVLTIGFARRFATYKRATLLLHDIDRLKALLSDDERPVQLVFAGKAHPADEPGKEFLREVAHLSIDPATRKRVVFLEDYDLDAGRVLTRGVDVWLNTPLRPMEACGTSGMKAALNGVLNLSVRDGWWDEAFRPEAGWAIPITDHFSTDPAQRDEMESNWLYELIEHEIVPLFYDRGPSGLPAGWTGRMISCIEWLAPQFHAGRMVRDYVEGHYVPAARRSRRYLVDDAAVAKDVAAWKAKVRRGWESVRIVEVEPPVDSHVDEKVTLRAVVALGGLSPDDVDVACLVGPVNNDGDIMGGDFMSMACEGGPPGSPDLLLYSAQASFDRAGSMGYAVRIVPRHAELPRWSDLGLARLTT
ncbi:MAG: alpha-glucan family phosphorylase [Microthrixaceae bacterium]